MSERENKRIGVLGAGSWGTALAKHLGDIGHQVMLWARRDEQAQAIESSRQNARYLPGLQLPDTLHATSSLEAALAGQDLVLSVVPSHTAREVWTEGRTHLGAPTPILSASKGIENDSLALMSAVLEDVLPGHHLAFLAGPSFAVEVARHLPTAVVIGSKDEALAQQIQRLVSSDWLRGLRHHRRDRPGAGRRAEERHRDRLRHLRRPRVRPQHTRGDHHPRRRRDQPHGGAARCGPADARRPRRDGRPGADLPPAICRATGASGSGWARARSWRRSSPRWARSPRV